MANVRRRITRTAALLAVLYAARRYYRNWGATKAEGQMHLPGDALVADPVVQTTEAICMDAPPAAVWPWLLQMGEDRAGSYLGEGDDERVHPQWQHLAVGDVVRLAPKGWLGLRGEVTLTVAEIVPEKYIVLDATRPDGQWNAVWSLHLAPHWENGTRLLTRVRIALRHPGEVFAMELLRPVVALGSRALLLGVKRRIERSVPAQARQTIS